MDNNYYLYYSNPSAANPPANNRNVYLWSDDFNRADNPDITTEASYSVKTGGGTWSIENGTLKNVGNSGDPNKLIITALGNVGTGVDMLVLGLNIMLMHSLNLISLMYILPLIVHMG